MSFYSLSQTEIFFVKTTCIDWTIKWKINVGMYVQYITILTVHYQSSLGLIRQFSYRFLYILKKITDRSYKTFEDS